MTAHRWSAVVAPALFLAVVPGRADEPIRPRETFAAGNLYRVSVRVDLQGTLTPPAEKGQPAPKPLSVKGDSAVEYDERVVSVSADNQVEKTIRIFRRIDLQRKMGDQPQDATVRAAVRRVVLIRHGTTEVPFSPDGPLTWAEIDLIRTDVFTPALAGLLPTQDVRPGETWAASLAAVRELTDLEKVEEGKVECKFERVETLEDRKHARIGFKGTVRGTNEDGPNRQQLDGYLYFDLQSNHVSYLSLRGTSYLLDKDGKELGKVEGRFVLTRQLKAKVGDLSDEAIKGVALEPNANNTMLLYDNPELGVKFQHPRRWRVGTVRGRQLTLDGADGSGLLLTLDPPELVPTGEQFLTETRGWLDKQKAKISRSDRPRKVQEKPPVEQFALEAEVGGKKVLLDYYVSRQAGGGATLAARLIGDDRATLQQEVERIARSVTITRTIKAK